MSFILIALAVLGLELGMPWWYYLLLFLSLLDH